MYKSILVIDDSVSTLKVIQTSLEKLAYKVYTAKTPTEGFSFLGKENIDLVLTDQEMPEMDGISTLKKIRTEYSSSLPVIMVTSHSSLRLGIEFMKAGGTDFLTKPVDILELSTKIKRAFNEMYVKNRLHEEEIAKRAVENAARLKEIFVATISHELRTPISIIGGYTELLAKSVVDEKQSQFIKKVSGGVKQLENMINEMLEVVLLQYEVNLSLAAVEVAKVIDKTVKKYTPLIADKGLRLTIDLENELPLVYVDEERFCQILDYLFDNALKFTHSGEIAVKAVSEGDRVRITVADTGVGIPKDQQNKIFDSFEKIKATEEREGIGLGLFISRLLVEILKGEIQVESVVGKGSQFSFTVPVAESTHS